jgi:hypothetical protein
MPTAALRRQIVHLTGGTKRKAWLIAGAVVVLAYPLWAGFLAGRLATAVLSSKLGVKVSAGRTWAGLSELHLRRVIVGEAADRAPLATVENLDVPFSALWGKGRVLMQRVHVELRRGGPRDNVAPLLARLGKKSGAQPSGGGGGARRLPRVSMQNASVVIEDLEKGRSLDIVGLDADVTPDGPLVVRARQVNGKVRLRGGDKDPRFGAGSLAIDGMMDGLRPARYPHVQVTDGFVLPMRTLPLTGITGTLGPGKNLDPGADPPLDIDLRGSYGGAKQALWTARGAVSPARGGGLDGELSLRADRFSLARVAEVLPSSIFEPARTNIDAALDFKLSSEKVSFTGNLDVTGLNISNEKLASDPIHDLGFSVRVNGAFEPRRHRLEMTRFEGRMGALVGIVSGSVELAPGVFHYSDGGELAALPKIDLDIKVPRIPCAKLLASIPIQTIPHLQGFVLSGNFDADLHTHIDYSNLEELDLGGKIGIDGCKVLEAPEEVTKLAGDESIIQMVDVPPKLGDSAAFETYMFPIGPANPDFVPYDKISPHLINSIMTTEDNGFFKHRGWVSSEFKVALRRNLQAGAFRFGASSISMQTIRNLLLAHEKTLSRKLQELFLTWYVEQLVPKQRILELYFNAIEYGPRIYGIGAAARHYFGKSASDLTPLESAFFSSILPSPKRRYVQYCSGAPNAKWDKYVRRILAKIHERGRLTDEEYVAAAASELKFDTTARDGTEKQCLEWVKKITTTPEPEPVEAEASNDSN